MKPKRFLIALLIGAAALVAVIVLSGPILGFVGRLPVVDEKPVQAEAVVVLYTGVDYYPRLIEAARLYTAGFVKTLVINVIEVSWIFSAAVTPDSIRGPFQSAEGSRRLIGWFSALTRIPACTGMTEKRNTVEASRFFSAAVTPGQDPGSMSKG